MHSLTPTTALGTPEPFEKTIGEIEIRENNDVALASISARSSQGKKCHDLMKKTLGNVPETGKAVFYKGRHAFWMGPEQWMVGAALHTNEELAAELKKELLNSASVTEQTGAWATFDISGTDVPDLCERLCGVPIRQMQSGDARRTVIHQLGCFIICIESPGHIRILGPRASAGSLVHALVTAAKSIA